jgi:hypothetical protein
MPKHCSDWKTLGLFVAVPFSTLKCRQNQIVEKENLKKKTLPEMKNNKNTTEKH